MPNLLNLDAESGANMVGDDSTPTLTFTNTGSGPGLQADDLVVTSTATIANMTVPTLSGITSLTANTARAESAANATIISFAFTGGSIASGAVFGLLNLSSFVSTATIKVTTAVAANTGAIRIVKPNGTFGWIPVYADGDVTAVAV